MGRAFGIACGRATRFLSFVLFLAAAAPIPSLAQRSNLERLQLCASMLADSVLSPFDTGDSLRLVVVEHPAGWLVDGRFLESAAEQGLVISDSPSAPVLTVALTELGVEYMETGDNDRLARRASMVINTIVPSSGSSSPAPSRSARQFEMAIVDTIDVSQALALESPGYPFSKGISVAAGTPGFWGKIVEPVVVLGASVVMVILLFTVRSQ